MSLVVDASIVIGWSMPDEKSDLADQALDHVAEFGGVTPDLFIWEISNVLAMALKRQRINFTEAEGIMEDIEDLELLYEPVSRDRVWVEVFGLTQKHRLTAYDAGYLELSRRLNVPLATLDKNLAAAAGAEGVSLFGNGGH